MPDEFIVSGESLVRNLTLGRARSLAYGARPSISGLVCDMFGHNSQLPQIFAGFGIEAGYIWRGVNARARNLLWVGADGTELPCYRFGPHGYGSYAVTVRRGLAFDTEPQPEYLDEYLAGEAQATAVEPVLLFDSCDHQDWDEVAYEMMLRRLENHPDYTLVHSSLDGYTRAMLEEFVASEVVNGELREPGLAPAGRSSGTDADEQWVIPGVASSRVYLKQGYDLAEATLLRWAEPFTVFAARALGVDYAPGLFDLAWGLLIENQAHDSIGGCSVDQVHRDMENRNEQALEVADKLAEDALRALVSSDDTPMDADELRIGIFNPLPRPFEGVVELDLPIPDRWPSFREFFGYEDKPGFRLYKEDGELSYQRIAQSPTKSRPRVRTTRLPELVSYRTVHVAAEVEVPAMGFATLRARSATPDDPYTRHPETPSLVTGERSMSNGRVAVTVSADGTLVIDDLVHGNRYEGCLLFEDDADIGDGWYHGPAVNDEVVVSAGGRCTLRRICGGPLLARFALRHTMSVPARFDPSAHTRSNERVDLVLETRITLRAGAAHVEFETSVHNTAADHRVRVVFVSHADTNTYLCDTPFDVVERAIALRPDRHLYRELETETTPHETWFGIHDGSRGLAVVSPGIREGAVKDTPSRPLVLTLYRCTQRTAFFYEQPEGQMLHRDLKFCYALVPLGAELDRVALTELGQRVIAPIRSVGLEAADVAITRRGGDLGLEHGFVELYGRVVLSSLRAVGDDVELRLVNPNADEATGTVRIDWGDGIAATQINLRGEREADLAVSDGEITVTLQPKQVKTVRLSAA
jgi:alpha-mannosidase/mannosylglycerate hydrolase